MQTVTLALVVLFSAFLALWPAAFLVAAGLHSFARRWQRLRRIAWLVPVWTIAASIGLMQLPRLLNGWAQADRPGPTLIAITAIVLAMCCAGVAWALLLRSFASDAVKAV